MHKTIAEFEAEIKELQQRNRELEGYIIANARISMCEINNSNEAKRKSKKIRNVDINRLSSYQVISEQP